MNISGRRYWPSRQKSRRCLRQTTAAESGEASSRVPTDPGEHGVEQKFSDVLIDRDGMQPVSESDVAEHEANVVGAHIAG